MWTRKELKEKGKKTFLFNYWKTVLVSLIFMILVGGAAGSFAGVGRSGDNVRSRIAVENAGMTTEAEAGAPYGFSYNFSEPDLPAEVIFIIVALVFLAIIVAVAVGIAFDAFLINPIEVGCTRFFTRNLNQKANVAEIANAFDNNYINVVKTTFLRDLYTALWTLLFIIPGIVKSYEYRMIPYILADHPEMSTKEVFAKSKELMQGQKWRAFVLDLSFIGWEILSLFTVQILGIFYVSPYRNMTNAALYERLEYGNLATEETN